MTPAKCYQTSQVADGSGFYAATGAKAGTFQVKAAFFATFFAIISVRIFYVTLQTHPEIYIKFITIESQHPQIEFLNKIKFLILKKLLLVFFFC